MSRLAMKLLERTLLIRDNADEDNENRNRSSLMAIAIGTFCALGGFLYGYDTGIINSLLSMQYVKHTFATNNESFTALETSVITAVLSLGTFVGALSAPLLSDTVGRRMTIIIISGLIFPLGTILQTASTRIPLLCVGRFISGIGVGIISAVVPVYQSEASPKWIRGAVVSTYQWAITWGLLVSSAVSQGTHSIDDSRSYRIPIALQIIWAYILAVGMYLLPESPRYYVKRDQLNEALNSLSRLRKLPPTNDDLIEELVEIKAQHDYEASFGKAKLVDCFRSSPSRHNQPLRMLTGMILQCLQQSTGINFIFYYGVNFFVGSGLSKSYIMSLITYTVNVVATIPGIILIEVIGRRRLLLIGASGMTICNLTIGIVGITTNSEVANKVMIAFVCAFIAFFASTWGPIVWVICSEVYSLDIRGKAVSITASVNWIVNFAFAFATPYLVDTGNHTASLGTKIFFIWGGCCFAGLIFSYLCVYETKGLMLEEVDEMYRCCKRASKSSAYKSKVHERYLNNELGFLSNDSDETKNIEMQATDLKSQEISSDTPTNTTLDHVSNGVKNDNPNEPQAASSQRQQVAPSDIIASLNLVNQQGFVPDLDFSRFAGTGTGTNNNDNMYHVTMTSRSPPSLDSASFYNNSSSTSEDDDDDNDNNHNNNNAEGLRYNYINEADLMNFINGLNRGTINGDTQRQHDSDKENFMTDVEPGSSSESHMVNRDSISLSSNTNGSTVQSDRSHRGSSGVGQTFTFSAMDASQQHSKDNNNNNNNNTVASDYTDLLSSLKLKSTSLMQSHTANNDEDGEEEEEEEEDDYEDSYNEDEDEDDTR